MADELLLAVVVPIIVGIGSALITQHLTRRREDRARLLQQKRETAAGALTAYHEHFNATRDWRVARAVAENGIETMERSWSKISEIERERQKLAESVDEARRAELDRRLEALRPTYADLRSTTQEHARREAEANTRRHQARAQLDYWTSLLEITCGEHVVAAYKDLYLGDEFDREASQHRFTQEVKAELSVLHDPLARVRRVAAETAAIMLDDVRGPHANTRPSRDDQSSQ